MVICSVNDRYRRTMKEKESELQSYSRRWDKNLSLWGKWSWNQSPVCTRPVLLYLKKWALCLFLNEEWETVLNIALFSSSKLFTGGCRQADTRQWRKRGWYNVRGSLSPMQKWIESDEMGYWVVFFWVLILVSSGRCSLSGDMLQNDIGNTIIIYIKIWGGVKIWM